MLIAFFHCTHLLAFSAGWTHGFIGVSVESVFFFFTCVVRECMSTEYVLSFFFEPAIFSILSTSICFIPLCMCRLHHVIFVTFIHCSTYGIAGAVSQGNM